MTFANLLNYVQGIFSRSFWFGSFLPIAIFAALNLIVVAETFPGSVQWDKWLKIDSNTWSYLPLTVVALVIAAYAVAPLVTVCRAVLDGTLLPDWLHSWLRAQRAAEFRKLQAQDRRALDDLGRFMDLSEGAVKELSEARRQGTGLAPTAQFPELLQGITDTETALRAGETVQFEAVRQYKIDLVAELRLTNADEVAEVHQAHSSLLNIVREARKDAEHRYLLLKSRNRGLAARPMATRIGDARAAVERYTLDFYAADFDFIWPRVQLVISKDSPLNDRIQAAQGQVDFAALSFVLAFLFTAIWGVLFTLYSPSLWPIFWLGTASLPILIFFYELLGQSQTAFGEVVKLVIDQYRLDLLTKVLRQPLPSTLRAERDLWRALCRVEQGVLVRDVAYRHPGPSS